MSEPILIYKKGEGWIYETNRKHPVTGRDGVTYYLIERVPVLGETWIYRATLKDALSDMRGYVYNDFRPLNEHDKQCYIDTKLVKHCFVISKD